MLLMALVLGHMLTIIRPATVLNTTTRNIKKPTEMLIQFEYIERKLMKQAKSRKLFRLK